MTDMIVNVMMTDIIVISVKMTDFVNVDTDKVTQKEEDIVVKEEDIVVKEEDIVVKEEDNLIFFINVFKNKFINFITKIILMRLI